MKQYFSSGLGYRMWKYETKRSLLSIGNIGLCRAKLHATYKLSSYIGGLIVITFDQSFFFRLSKYFLMSASLCKLLSGFEKNKNTQKRNNLLTFFSNLYVTSYLKELFSPILYLALVLFTCIQIFLYNILCNMNYMNYFKIFKVSIYRQNHSISFLQSYVYVSTVNTPYMVYF